MISTALHLVAAALLCLLLGDAPPPIFVASLALALLPDLDTPKSLVGSLLRPLSIRVERALGHRTATHGVLALALVVGGAYLLTPAYWLPLAGGYASHLILDLLIGVQGIQLFWPAREWLTLTSWRDDGPAPRILLLALLPAALATASWAQIRPLVVPTISAAALVANPIATPRPTTTPRPSVQLHFTLPAGVGLSAVRVRAGDTVREGQVLASWEVATPTAWATPTTPPLLATPAAISVAPGGHAAALALAAQEAQAALDALTTMQGAARAALIADQQQEFAAARRVVKAAQQKVDQLQPQHEREQDERHHAVVAAQTALSDAQAAKDLASDENDAQRAAERVHKAEGELQQALDAESRMRAEQGIERQQAETKLAQAQADLVALPETQRVALTKLDAEQAAARTLAEARVKHAAGLADDEQRASVAEAQRLVITATTAAAMWQSLVTATAQAHAGNVLTTAQALPSPVPNRIVSHAAGQVVNVSAEEQEGRMLITVELTP